MAEVRVLLDEPDSTGVFRRFAPHLWRHRRIIVPALLVSLTASAAQVLLAPAIGQGVDALAAVDRDGLLVWAGVLLGLVLARALLLRGAERLLTRAGEKVVRTLRDMAVEGLAGAPLRFLEAHRTGDLLRRATGEIAELAAFVRQHVPDLLAIGSNLVFTFVVLMIYSWQLTLVLLVLFVPAAIGVVTWFERGADAAFGSRAVAEAALSARYTETVAAGEAIAAAGGTAGRLRQLDADIAEVRRTTRWVVRIRLRLAGTGFIEGMATAALLLAGALAVVLAGGTVGTVAVFVLATRSMFDGFRSLSDLVAELQMAKTGLARLLDLFDAAAPYTVDDEQGSGLPAHGVDSGLPAHGVDSGLPAHGDLVVETVGYSYGGPVVLDSVSLHIAAGERVGLVGETGSGKSTLAKLLSGLYEADSGTVRFGEVDLCGVDPRERRRRIVLVPQAVHTIGASVADNVALIPSRPDRAAIERAVDALGVRDWVDGLPEGLDTRVGAGGRALSAGEQQLVGLVRATLTDPAVLILDEATSDLDPDLARQLESAVERTRAGATVIVIAHRTTTIDRLPRVVRLDGGRVVADTRTVPSPTPKEAP